MSQEDFNLFQQMVKDVKPLNHDTTHFKKNHQATDAQLARREAAILLRQDDQDYLSLTQAPMIKPYDIIAFKRNGVQNGVYRKLKLGKYPVQARLDLHRYSLEEARKEVVSFIQQCNKMDIRTVLIVHGKGERANPPALLKSFIAHWLPQIEDVQCAHSAQPFHGGSGAIYVLLRKSQAKKQENRERHQKRLAHP